MTIIAAIPAYNEERTIAKMVLTCQKFVDRVIVCDDGSADLTGWIAERMGADVLRHERNMGKGESLRSLFRVARKLDADIMVTIDADGQHDANDIPKLVDRIKNGSADIVVGSRFIKNGASVPQHRRIVNKMLNLLTLEGVSDTQSGFRAYNKRAIQWIKPAEMGMGVDSEILIQASDAGLNIDEIPIEAKYGIGKTSKLNPFYHTLDVLASIIKLASVRHPLIFFGVPGTMFVLVGIYYLVRTVLLFSKENIITTLTLSYGLLAFAITIFGMLILFTGVILFTISSLLRKSQQ